MLLRGHLYLASKGVVTLIDYFRKEGSTILTLVVRPESIEPDVPTQEIEFIPGETKFSPVRPVHMVHVCACTSLQFCTWANYTLCPCSGTVIGQNCPYLAREMHSEDWITALDATKG